MAVQDKIRSIREMYQLTQEDMAEKMGVSPSAYAKLERGETKLSFDKLEKIAEIFKMTVTDLTKHNGNIVFWINESGDYYTANHYTNTESLTIELEKMKLSLEFQNQIIAQKDSEIAALKEIIQLMKK